MLCRPSSIHSYRKPVLGWGRAPLTNGNYIQHFLLDANVALLGAALFYWSKPMARTLNSWTVRCNERFPKLKVLPGSQNAGTELNYKIAYIWFRVCGAFAFISSVVFVILFLRLRN